ncbi:MAG TPA: hydroxymethylbilane synthase [Steroidobacteraceae bacterium]
MLQRPLRLGTRRSLLARAQSAAVARRLEQMHHGLKVELVGIDTRGDRITSTPLSQVDGKEFFTAEIDAALRAGDVDLTVHSYKDLSLERPADLQLGAVPARENPRDIVYFAADVPERLASGVTLRIGSSSPRRQAFVPPFLERALPHSPRVELCELRGNVDSRLRRLREPRGSERQLDGVILAFAGLSRLWQDQAVGAATLLRELLAGLPRMLLPLTLCPAAPAQGALAIECRSADVDTLKLLAAIDDPATRAGVAAERALLAQRGGGCHQRFGATQVQIDGLGPLLYLRDAGEQGPLAPEVRWKAPAAPRPPLRPWDGSTQPAPAMEAVPGVAAEAERRLAGATAAFIAHRRALPELPAAAVNRCAHVWVSGTESWFALAARGVWVEGCAESLGFAVLRPILAAPLLALPPPQEWLALTHQEAAAGWAEVPVLATYRRVGGTGAAGVPEAGGPPPEALQLWWHSGVQFERWGAQAARACQHACGPGKTADLLRRRGVQDLTVFPSVQHWWEWLQT